MSDFSVQLLGSSSFDSTASEPAHEPTDSAGSSNSADSTDSADSTGSVETPETTETADSTSTGPSQSAGSTDPGAPPRSARRLRIDADSPFAEAVDVFAASDRAQLSVLDVSAGLFFSETVENLRLFNPHPESPYQHATIAETVRRYRREARSSCSKKNASTNGGTKANATTANASEGNASTESGSQGGGSKLPSFPKFRMNQTFYGWVHELSQAEDIAEFTTVMGSTTSKAYTL